MFCHFCISKTIISLLFNNSTFNAFSSSYIGETFYGRAGGRSFQIIGMVKHWKDKSIVHQDGLGGGALNCGVRTAYHLARGGNVRLIDK